jgi:hypothetical protein
MSFARPEALRRRFDRILNGRISSAIDEFLARKQAIHFGGMSDPFSPLEQEHRVTFRHLEILSDFMHPTVVSTKSDIIARDEYLRLLKDGRFVVQFSISSTRDDLLGQIDIGTSGPTRLFQSAQRLAAEGIPVACRLQPLLPGAENDAYDVIDACAAVGVRHVAVEHLKLPVEAGWRGTIALSETLGIDLVSYYRSMGSTRVGREWILPVHGRLRTIIALRDYAWSRGLSFGAADNDLIYLSDGRCCCSGLDLLLPDAAFYSNNYVQACYKVDVEGKLRLRSLREEWSPERTIARFVNSRSRLEASSEGGVRTMRDYIADNWNCVDSAPSPASLWGVSRIDEVDEDGNAVYAFDTNAAALTHSKKR